MVCNPMRATRSASTLLSESRTTWQQFGNGSRPAPALGVRFVFERASDPAALESRYRDAGLELSSRAMALDEARALPTTWAKKLGYSGGQRTFWDFGAPRWSKRC